MVATTHDYSAQLYWGLHLLYQATDFVRNFDNPVLEVHLYPDSWILLGLGIDKLINTNT